MSDTELKPPQWQVGEASDFCRDVRVVPEDEALATLAHAQQAIAQLEARCEELTADRTAAQASVSSLFRDRDRWSELAVKATAERDAARAELAAMRERVEAVEKDARRYRTLRLLETWPSPDREYRAGLCVDLWDEDGCGIQISGEELDAEVDAAISASRGKGSQ